MADQLLCLLKLAELALVGKHIKPKYYRRWWKVIRVESVASHADVLRVVVEGRRPILLWLDEWFWLSDVPDLVGGNFVARRFKGYKGEKR